MTEKRLALYGLRGDCCWMDRRIHVMHTNSGLISLGKPVRDRIQVDLVVIIRIMRSGCLVSVAPRVLLAQSVAFLFLLTDLNVCDSL